MSARDKFVGIKAEYWACNDPDCLTHQDPISALEDWIDSHFSREGEDAEAVIREMGDIAVEAYSRVAIREADIDDAIDRAIEVVDEHLQEQDYHDPDGDHQMFSVDVLTKHRPKFEAAVRALVADASVWHCDVTATVTLTPDETLEIMRVERPDWFEKEGA